MSRSDRAYEWFIGFVMYFAFVVAFAWGVLVVATLFSDSGPASFGDFLTAAGVYLALGFFYHTERMRRRMDRSTDARFNEIVEEIRRIRCACETEAAGACDGKSSG